jgi:hypothetical protein
MEHHDVELVDEAGRRLARAWLPEGIAGITRLHELLAAQVAEDAEAAQIVVVGIETDRGPWVGALVASGYQVDAINPMRSPATGSGTAPQEPRVILGMRTCWPSWSAWTGPGTARSLGTAS